MRKTILARVVARALSFPEQIEVQCQPVDADGRPIGTAIYNFGPFTWEAVKHKFWIDEPYADVCVKNFEEGSPALISSVLEWERDWPEPDDISLKHYPLRIPRFKLRHYRNWGGWCSLDFCRPERAVNCGHGKQERRQTREEEASEA